MRTALLFACAMLPLLAQGRFDLSAIDRSVSPCEDFYQYSCGAWLARTPVPQGNSKFMEIQRMNARSTQRVNQMVDVAAKPDPGRDPLTKRIGDYYFACMDTATIERKGAAPFHPWLERLHAIRSREDLMAEAARLTVLGASPFWSLSGLADDSVGVLLWTLSPPGDEKQPLVGSLAEFVRTLFQLAGDNATEAAASFKTAARVDRALPTRSRKAKADRFLTLDQAERLLPNLYLRRQRDALRIPAGTQLRIKDLAYFRKLNGVLAKMPLEDWKTFLAACFLVDVTGASAELLPRAFVDARVKVEEAFGVKREQSSREEFCRSSLEGSLGETMGRAYVERYFPPEKKRRLEDMVADMRAAVRKLIDNASWMSAGTRKQALEKLAAMEVAVGNPSHWKEFGPLRIERDDALGNLLRASEVNGAQWLSQLGKRMDRQLWWDWDPITPNLGYVGHLNAVQLPAVMLDPPAFDERLPDAVNYSSLGGGIGHELAHAFDDGGRRYDAQGILRDWWAPEDAKQYAARAQCFVEQYSAAPLPVGLHVDGKKTLNENIADSAGMAISYAAFAKALARRGQRMDDPAAGQDGYTPAQLYFLGWAINRCAQLSSDALRAEVANDNHSPERLRVNMPVSNLAAFREAYSCKPGQPMAPVRACTIW